MRKEEDSQERVQQLGGNYTHTVSRAWRQLGIATLLIVVVWIGVLPRLDTLPAIDRHMQLLDEKGIDAAALFYTDLECMAEVEEHMAVTRANHPNAFWPDLNDFSCVVSSQFSYRE